MRGLIWVLLSVAAAALQTPAVSVSRRALLGGVAGAACATCTPVLPASATLKAELLDGQAELASASTTETITAALEKLLTVVDDFGGLPSQELSEQVVNSMRTKRSSLSGNSEWNGITEEAYNKLMRSVDPWRVTELRGPLQNAIFSFPLAYAALLVVQQIQPKFFQVAYGVAAAVILGPLLFQIIVG